MRDLTAYNLRCGHVQTFQNSMVEVKLYHEGGVYHVTRVHPEHRAGLWDGGYKDWTSFHTVGEARKCFRDFCKIGVTKHLFNTGVKPWSLSVGSYTSEHTEWHNNEKHIVFYCYGVPKGATFAFASPSKLDEKRVICRPIVGGGLVSEYAYFYPEISAYIKAL